MRRRLEVFGGIVCFTVTLLLILSSVWLIFSRRPFPTTNGIVEMPGLTAPVEIYRDSYGVPHIYARNSQDLFFAQGYVHAQDRYWQMEMWRRISAGRLSEWFGDTALDVDIYFRALGFKRIAEREYAEADQATRDFLEAYTKGVNAYILSREPGELGIEFSLIGLQGVDVEIEPWEVTDILAWTKIVAQGLSNNMRQELERVNLIQTVGFPMTSDYIPAYRTDMPLIVPKVELAKMELSGSAAAQTEDASLPYLIDLNMRLLGSLTRNGRFVFTQNTGIGSNGWVISGKLTTTGKPLLANDPHLNIQIPSMWYEVGLHCAPKTSECPYDLRGFSFAGAPGVVLGHNDRIAWGLTNLIADIQDLYIEQLNPENPDQYRVGDQWVDMEIITEEIEVWGREEPYLLRARYTRHGPIISDHNAQSGWGGIPIVSKDTLTNLETTALALRWTALLPVKTFRSIRELNAAQDYDDFYAALRYLAVPPQSFFYADVDGNIAYQAAGIIPIRTGGDGSLPVPGWTNEYDWAGFIPYDELPRVLNPAQGYIVTANNPVADPDDYPYLIGTEFDHGYRARRIMDMIEGDVDGISFEDMTAIQGDGLCLSALEVLPYLKGLYFADPEVRAARDRLLRWDGQMDMDSPEAALYAYFWAALMEGAFSDQLPGGLGADGNGRTQNAVYVLLDESNNPWWDDSSTLGEIETRDDILKSAFVVGYQRGVERFGSRLDAWCWGAIHTTAFSSQTFGQSGIALLKNIFNRGPVATSGGSGVINATGWDASSSFASISLPALRQVIDLADFSNSRMIHTTGQSGHSYHRHYNDFIEPWRLIQYHPTLWERAEVEANSSEHLMLVPAGDLGDEHETRDGQRSPINW
ncbi:MAG: penicillin acylase family protein [Anaerolineae bacterium]|nr:penicillin acylase family protein [Anaerolineae bacterium]